MGLIRAKLPPRDSIQPLSHPCWPAGAERPAGSSPGSWREPGSTSCCVRAAFEARVLNPVDFDGNEIWGRGMVRGRTGPRSVCAYLLGALPFVVGCFSFSCRHRDFCNQRPTCRSQLLLVISTEKSARGLIGLEIGLFHRGLWSGKMELSPRAAGERPLLSDQELCDASQCSWASYYLFFQTVLFV